MSDRVLLVEVRLVDSRYHGVGDWPPSPFRLFQALVAGAYGGRWCAEPREQKDAAFEWLEALGAPVVAAPSGVLGRTVNTYVPHNDSDVGAIQDIRAEKQYQPRTIDAPSVLRYAWRFDDGEEHAVRIARLAGRLYALGRGIDPAYAQVSLVDWTEEVARTLGAQGLIVHAPVGPGVADDVRCPSPGSFASLRRRYEAMANRFEAQQRGRVVSTLFRQPPRALCSMVAYDRGPTRLLFDLSPADASRSFRPVPQQHTVSLTIMVRDLAARRLVSGLPGRERDVERFIVGRGITARESHQRIRIVPLPSIGHAHADSIRRVMVEIPHASPFAVADVEWALSGQALSALDRVDQQSGEVAGETLLIRSHDEGMLAHYGVGDSAMVWRSITPVALPVPLKAESEARRHGGQQARLVRGLSGFVADALRHAGFDPRGTSIRVQREPFQIKGRLAVSYAADRFPASVLHHVEVTFPSAVTGPVIVGDGRFLGLGLCAPMRQVTGVHAFAVTEALSEDSSGFGLVRALRRAVMARVQPLVKGPRLAALFSGHEAAGSPARSEPSHLTFALDPGTPRLLVIAPHLIDRRESTREERDSLDVLDRAMVGFRELRAGRAGLLTLSPIAIDTETDPLFAPATTWETITPYVVTRHQKGSDAHAALAADARLECRRRGLPEPVVTVLSARGVAGRGLTGMLRINFAVAVRGPVSLGRDRHFGGGLCVARVGA